MKLKITANDALCFGRGRTTNAGETSFGSEMFPPYPTVLLGALRSAFLSQHPQYIPYANTEGDPTLDYEISFYSLLLDGELFMPAPADTYTVESDSTHLDLLTLLPNDDDLSSYRLPYYLYTHQDGKVNTSDGLWISISTFGAYLRGDDNKFPGVKLSSYIKPESRVGIARDDAVHSVSGSMYFSSTMTRLHGVAFAVELKGSKYPDPDTILRLGKHSKTAKFEPSDFSTDVEGLDCKNGFFKLYFATPAIFDGAVPNLPKALPTVVLVAAAVSGYENIGGYDMAKNQPKPTKRAIKAGSVFYYRIKDFNPENGKALFETILKTLHGKRISNENTQAGFGLCYVGTVADRDIAVNKKEKTNHV